MILFRDCQDCTRCWDKLWAITQALFYCAIKPICRNWWYELWCKLVGKWRFLRWGPSTPQLNLFLFSLLNFEGNWVVGRLLFKWLDEHTTEKVKRNGLSIFIWLFFEKSFPGCAGCIRFSNNLFELCTMTWDTIEKSFFLSLMESMTHLKTTNKFTTFRSGKRLRISTWMIRSRRNVAFVNFPFMICFFLFFRNHQ